MSCRVTEAGQTSHQELRFRNVLALSARKSKARLQHQVSAYLSSFEIR